MVQCSSRDCTHISVEIGRPPIISTTFKFETFLNRDPSRATLPMRQSLTHSPHLAKVNSTAQRRHHQATVCHYYRLFAVARQVPLLHTASSQMVPSPAKRMLNHLRRPFFKCLNIAALYDCSLSMVPGISSSNTRGVFSGSRQVSPFVVCI